MTQPPIIAQRPLEPQKPGWWAFIVPIAVAVLVGMLALVINFVTSPHTGGGPASESSQGTPWEAILPAAGGVAGTLIAAFAAFLSTRVRLRAERDSKGFLEIGDAITAVRACIPHTFSKDELKRRRKVNSHIDKVATASEQISARHARNEPGFHDDLYERLMADL